MRFEDILAKAIQDEAQKLALRHHSYHNWLHQEINRKNQRTTTLTSKTIHEPEQWAKSNLFNPFYVHKHAQSIAKSISRKILNKEYTPNRPFIRTIPKPSGGNRDVSIYQIPDAAISTFFFTYLMKKNRHRFSNFTYAYRNDKNAHFAVQDIFYEIKKFHRVYIAEYDFSKFFDNIDHKFILYELSNNNFFVSETEEYIIKAFLKSRHHIRGIPQGTSISLFLANIACWNLDRQLELEGIKFARYADDTIMWSQQYEKICRASNIIFDFSIKSKISINIDKSEGISLLVPFPHEPQEVYKVKNNFQYLGYSISPKNICIKKDSEIKIKKEISYLIYSNLLQPIKNRNIKKIPKKKFYDRDVIVCLQQIRRYLYGNLSEELIKKFMFGGLPTLSFKGIMSYYPLVTDIEQLKQLDGWLAGALMRTLRKRYQQLPKIKILFNYGTTKDFVDDYKGRRNGIYTIPSFITIHKAIQKGLKNSGLNFNDTYAY